MKGANDALSSKSFFMYHIFTFYNREYIFPKRMIGEKLHRRKNSIMEEYKI